jgi:hypothetical protein
LIHSIIPSSLANPDADLGVFPIEPHGSGISFMPDGCLIRGEEVRFSFQGTSDMVTILIAQAPLAYAVDGGACRLNTEHGSLRWQSMSRYPDRSNDSPPFVQGQAAAEEREHASDGQED